MSLHNVFCNLFSTFKTSTTWQLLLCNLVPFFTLLLPRMTSSCPKIHICSRYTFLEMIESMFAKLVEYLLWSPSLICVDVSWQVSPSGYLVNVTNLKKLFLARKEFYCLIVGGFFSTKGSKEQRTSATAPLNLLNLRNRPKHLSKDRRMPSQQFALSLYHAT